MQSGDVILVDFTATERITNQIVETTIEQDAKKANAFNPKAMYKPVPLVVGKKELFEKVDKAFEIMQVGDEKKIELEASEAFGERKAELIAIIPLQQFKKQKMNPMPGLIIEADGKQGKVQSVSGGRVRVDFNHPLAGKKIEYKVVVRKKIEDKQEQVEAIFEKYFPHVKPDEKQIKVEGETVKIVLPERLKEQKETTVFKQVFAKILPDQLGGIKEVQFVESFETQKKDSKKTESKTQEKPAKKEGLRGKGF
ncbi:peptidylprolyl isomerase [Candidatus Micrarchaeota archaeon]|nr:peptidylprolyl isomerase [Candidatus Micrarchaeota archaeon]MBU1930777.1 peptidylprolyl isomerase [Candidatus Micrarchaeota archaeon]